MNENVNLKELQKRNEGSSNLKAKKDNLKEILEQNKDFIKDLLPKHMNTERLLRLAVLLYTSVPKLGECNAASILGAVLHCVSIGLEFNTPLGHCYIIPFFNRKSQKYEPQVILGYKGMIELMYRTGKIKNIHADVVRSDDKFNWEYGKNHELIHKPNFSGSIKYFYAYVHLINGGFQFVVLPKSKIDSIRTRSQTGGMKESPWETDYEAMGMKTAMKQLSKYAQLSSDVSMASAIDDLGEIGLSQNLKSTLWNNANLESSDNSVSINDLQETKREPDEQKSLVSNPKPRANTGKEGIKKTRQKSVKKIEQPQKQDISEYIQSMIDEIDIADNFDQLNDLMVMAEALKKHEHEYKRLMSKLEDRWNVLLSRQSQDDGKDSSMEIE